MSQLDLLTRLDGGAVDTVVRESGKPVPPLVVSAARGDADAVRAIASAPASLAEAFGSPLGPVLASPLAVAAVAVGRGELLPGLVQRLVAAPLRPGPLLNRLLELAGDDPVGVAAAATRLDALYRDLPPTAEMPPSLVRALALPAATGMCADVYVVASETGAVLLSPGPALANILRVTLDQADALSVLDVLTGHVVLDRVVVPAEVLASSASSAARLGAYGTAARLAVLAVMLGQRDGTDDAVVQRAREELAGLLALTTKGGRHRVLMGRQYRELARAACSPAVP